MGLLVGDILRTRVKKKKRDTGSEFHIKLVPNLQLDRGILDLKRFIWYNV